jgi:hypothetical protein
MNRLYNMNGGKIWVPQPQQAKRYTEKDLLIAARKIGCHDVKSRTVRTFVELGLLDGPYRDRRGYGGGSSKGWWPRAQLDLWCTLMRQRKQIIAREGAKDRINVVLCNVAVAAWLYFGEAAGIPLTQVQRAMRTWAHANARIRSYLEANRQARRFIRMAAHLSAEDLLNLRKYFAEMLFAGHYPEREELLYEIRTLVDPHNRGEIKGPAEAPISAENLTDMILGRVKMLERLRRSANAPPDGLWEWAHCMLIWAQNQYQAAQPGMVNDPSLKIHPELAQIYHPENFETLVNRACEDLLAVLSTSELALGAPHLPAPLRPAPWVAGHMHVKIESQQRLSERQRLDGSRLAYLGISVQVTRQSDSNERPS